MTEITPLISICIANFNGIGLIDACIASIQKQTFQLPIETIVHDDASPDGSADYIRGKYPTVRLIESIENVGFCISNNRMVAQARGRYVLLLNNDATLFPDALTALMQEAKRLQQPAILTLPQYDDDSGALLDIGSRLDPFLNPVPNLDPTRNDVGTVHGACMWIDKNLWDELDGFPEWFGSVAEDLYLCCYARLLGNPVRALGISGFRHRVGASFGGGKVQRGGLSTTFRRRALSECNKTFVMIMTFPSPFMQLLVPLHLLLLLMEGALLSALRLEPRYWTDIYWPVVMGLIRQLARLVETRRCIIQKGRLANYDFFSVFDWLPHKLRMLFRHGLPRVL